jgi:hypothetical protein
VAEPSHASSGSTERWLAALDDRYRRAFTPPEFLKAVRALSARYVERRGALVGRSPLDSAGKRAAFAAFYAPLHFLTTRAAVRALGAESTSIGTLVDLGCGTGAASAAWAAGLPAPPRVLGVDASGWARDEAEWTWRACGLSGRARRGDLVREAARLLDPPVRDRLDRTGVLLAWSVNELEPAARPRLLASLLELSTRAAAVLVIEPLAGRAVPWWAEWAAAWSAHGGRADEWTFDAGLPPALAAVNAAAGFGPRRLTARTLYRHAARPLSIG